MCDTLTNCLLGSTSMIVTSCGKPMSFATVVVSFEIMHKNCHFFVKRGGFSFLRCAPIKSSMYRQKWAQGWLSLMWMADSKSCLKMLPYISWHILLYYLPIIFNRPWSYQPSVSTATKVFEKTVNREYLAPQIRSMNNWFHSEAKLPWSYDYTLANHTATNKAPPTVRFPCFRAFTLL